MSHVHILQVLLPLVPGMVVTVGLSLSSSSLAQRFWSIGLGYKTKLGGAIALTYILGLALMTAAQNVTSFFMGKLKRPSGVAPWDNSYWRRVAAAYVGDSLLPTPGPLSREDLDRFLAQVAKLTPDAQAAVTKYRDAVQTLEHRLGALQELEANLSRARESAAQAARLDAPQIRELLNSSLDSITQGADVLEKARPAVQNAKQVLDNASDHLRALGTDREWNAIYYALEFLPTETESPFGSFVLLMASLQAAGISGILLIFQYRELRSMIGVICSVILILITTYAQWLNFRVDRFRRDLASPQIAVMIQDIRQQRKHDARSPDPNDVA